jgi:hypothetical protein
MKQLLGMHGVVNRYVRDYIAVGHCRYSATLPQRPGLRELGQRLLGQLTRQFVSAYVTAQTQGLA